MSVTLLAAAGHTLAFSLGKVRGGVVLGQPLALSFDVKLDSGEEFPVSCVEASVTQGDNRMDSSRIRVAFSGRGADGVVELSSTQLIEEPAVTVTLRAGCDQKTSRKYVLLTELPTETRSTPTAAPAVVPRASNPMVASEGSRASDVMVEGRAATSAPGQPTLQPVMPRSEPVASAGRPTNAATAARAQHVRNATSDVKPPVERQASKQKAHPHLKLEAPDLSAERIADLRLSPALSVLPQEGASAQRSQALALWLALNASPEQVAADGQRKASLEAQNQSLNAAAKAERAKVGDLQARLQDAEDAKYANPLVYALAGLSGLMLLGGAWFWKRRGLPALPKVKGPAKGKNPWWQTGLKPAVAPMSELPAQPEVEPVTAAPGPKVGLSDFAGLQGDRLAPGGLVSGLQVDLDLSESAFRRLEGLGQAESPAASPVASPRPTPQMPARPTAPVASPMTSEQAPADLFDVQQHAEFFVSLGQYDEAITVLRHHIEQYPGACPLAYLDLLKIHHMLSHTVEYASLREAFNALFSGEIPVFSAFSKGGKSLESYPRTMAHLEKSWPTPRVLSAVEACLFRSYADTHGETFELDAFKDLLVLQAVAAQLSKDASAGTPVQPRIQAGDLSLAFQAARDAGTAHQATAGQIPVELMPLDPISGFGPSTQMPAQEPALDLDLSEPALAQPADSGMPAPQPLQTAFPPSDEIPLHEMPTGLIFESPLDSPLDEKPVEPPAAAVVDDEHLIDFDIFEADLKAAQASNKS